MYRRVQPMNGGKGGAADVPSSQTSSSQPSNSSSTAGKEDSGNDGHLETAHPQGALGGIGERWRNGCHYHYVGGGCRAKACPFFHDLDDNDKALYLSCAKQNHVLYTDTSDSNSKVNSSSGKSGDDPPQASGSASEPHALFSSTSPGTSSSTAMKISRMQSTLRTSYNGRREDTEVDTAARAKGKGKLPALTAQQRARNMAFDGQVRPSDGATRKTTLENGGTPKAQHSSDELEGEDSDEDREPPVIDARLQELVDKLAMMDTAALQWAVPVDREKRPSSIGSMLQAEGCCEPCASFENDRTCVDGIRCRCCHLSHKHGSRRKHKLRPCKGKRDRYRRLVSRIAGMIDENPEGFDVQDMDLPPSVATNEVLKRKITARMKLHAENLVSGCPGEGEPPIRHWPAAVGAQPVPGIANGADSEIAQIYKMSL